jgi:hypothetical protein
MKTIKKILAWLDWSSYANKDYELPKSLCSLFWRTLFSLVSLPITYLTHVWNAFIKPNYNDFQYNNKSNLFIGAVIHGVILIAGAVGGTEFIEPQLSVQWLTWEDPFVLGYVKIMFTGIGVILTTMLFIIIIVGIIVGIVELVKLGWNAITESEQEEVIDENNQVIDYEYKEKPLVKLYKSIKGKYCPKIDWSEIKKNE